MYLDGRHDPECQEVTRYAEDLNMKILQMRDADDCFDGSFMKEAILEQPATESFILYLGGFGELQYYSDFKRPFFRLDIPQKLILKGIQGMPKLTVIFSRDDTEGGVAMFEQIVSRFDVQTEPTRI